MHVPVLGQGLAEFEAAAPVALVDAEIDVRLKSADVGLDVPGRIDLLRQDGPGTTENGVCHDDYFCFVHKKLPIVRKLAASHARGCLFD